MTPAHPPLILNFDAAVSGIPQALTLELQAWQDRIRFGCRWRDYRQLQQQLAAQLPPHYGCVFTGSGDYHHISWLLLQRAALQQDVQLVVCDNHPDNMRYPFGIHCGSWVYWASHLPNVRQIHVLGIGSADIGWRHAWENHWSPLLRGRLTYWSIGQDARWLSLLRAGERCRAFADADTLLQSFLHEMDDQLPVYLSIDKDVLSREVITTNWDQGTFEERHLQHLISACRSRLAGADITGDVSAWRYHSRFKRWLAAADGQQTPARDELKQWQQQQNALNLRLLAAIDACWQG